MAKYTNRMDEDYIKFRALISQQKVVVDIDNEVWTLYDAGPKNVLCPLLCLPPAIGTADAFFKQIIGLSTRGYRIITLSYPVYWTMDEFIKGLTRLIDQLGLNRVHLFGASLGGYLAQKFVEETKHSKRVHSLFLCNSFHDTAVFRQSNLSGIYWTLPAFMLRRTLLQHLPADGLEVRVAEATDFMVERLDSLTRSELASRLTLNCSDSYVEPQHLRDIPVTVMDVFDECAITQGVKDDMYKCYPQAKRAHLKTGGNFPYLSRSTEVNLYLEIHLRQFVGTPFSALDPARLSQCEAELIEELRHLEELEKQGKSTSDHTNSAIGQNKTKEPERLTNSKDFPQVPTTAELASQPGNQVESGSFFDPHELTDSEPPIPTLDLKESDFIDQEPRKYSLPIEPLLSQVETKKVMKEASPRNSPISHDIPSNGQVGDDEL